MKLLAATLLALTAAGAHAQTQAQLGLSCKEFIERQLHDPRDADLEWTKATVRQEKGGLWRVQFRGRARNQMGGMSLATFECLIRYTAPDNFSAVNIRVF